MRKLHLALAIFMITVGFVSLLLNPAFSEIHYPKISSNYMTKVPKTTIITDRKGEPLYYYYKDENRIVVPSEAISEAAKNAVIAAEDERFYHHAGFDLASTFRALVANAKAHGIVSGGSTLTMQLVKNVTGNDERSFKRKISEIYLAMSLEQRVSKEQILTDYLNIVSYGGNISGIETASRLYFKKPAKTLTAPEAATLIALISSPNYYIENPSELKIRRDYVLSRMRATRKLTQQEYEEAKSKETPLSSPDYPLYAPHFTFEVINQLEKEYGDSLATRGLTIKTTLDRSIQSMAEDAVRDNSRTLGIVNADTAGLVATDPRTGEILALVGSPDFNNKDRKGEVNVATAPYSFGSTLKPLIYSLLLEKEHWSPGAIVWDVRTQFPLTGQAPYIPKNYDNKYYGPMTLREALATSRNVPAIKAIQMVGLGETVKKLKELGASSLKEPTDYGPSLAVGGAGIPLVEMTSLYTPLANNGKANKASYVQSVTDSNGKVLKEYRPENKEVLRPEVAYEIADILQDNEARRRVFGPRSPLVIDGHTVAAKTGTSEDYRTALTIGFTPELVVGVIVANNDYSPLRMGAAGAMAAAPIFNTFMNDFVKNKPNYWFEQPNSIKREEFNTIIGKKKDLIAPWQSPTDRFTKYVAEIDDPLWNRAVISTRKPAEKKENETTVTVVQAAQ